MRRVLRCRAAERNRVDRPRIALPYNAPMDATAAICIALLTPADVAEYRRVRLRALGEHPEAFRSDATAEAAKPIGWWEERLAPREQSNATFFGAWTPARQLVGTAGLLFETRRTTRHTASIVGMYVAAEHGGRGVGARLLDACIDLAHSDACLEILYLTVTSTNTGAIRLYERAGFVPYGCEPRSMRIGDRTFDKLLMSLPLQPE
jgi:RimJ/RimL family protein N-acetyltransferase